MIGVLLISHVHEDARIERLSYILVLHAVGADQLAALTQASL